MQKAHSAFRMRCRLKDRPLVVGQLREPLLQIRSMIRPRLELRRDTEVGAEEATAKFGDEFFPRPLRPVLGIARQATSHAMFCRRLVGRLMAEDGRVSGSVAKRLKGRHLDVVHDRG